MRKETTIKTSLLTRVLLVVVAFLIMIISSSAVMYNTLNEKLLLNAETAMDDTQTLFSRILGEPETALNMIAANVESIYNRGDGLDAVKAYIDEVSSSDFIDRIKTDYYSACIYFEAADEFHSGRGGPAPAADFNARERPWYLAAPVSGGIGMTAPYIDRSISRLVVSYSCRIFDAEGEGIGVVAIDVFIDIFRDMVINKQITPNSYGYMIDETNHVVMHPNTSREGQFFWESNSATEQFADLIYEGEDISFERSVNFEGIPVVIFGRQIYNDWYFVLVVPEREYYAELYSMITVTGVLGTVLAVALIAVLVSLERARRRADDEYHKKVIQIAEMEQTQEADRRIRLMLDRAPLCVIYWNSDLEVIDCNLEGVKLFDLSSKDELMERWYDLSPKYQPDGKESALAIQDVVCETLDKSYTKFEWMHQKLDGEEIPCEVTLITVMFNDTTGLLGYIRDLREVNAILNDLNEALNEAKIANQAKSAFLAQMSHEIRTPMNSIMGVTEILMEAKLPEEAMESLGIIYNSSDLLLGIINDILDFSKIEAGKMDLHPDTYFIASVINDSVNLNMMRIGSKNIEFELDVDENLPAKMIGDELRLKQILNNVLSNAFKYTDEGTVVLSVSHEKNDDSVTLVFNVRDTGCGMTDDQIDMLFSEYARFNQNKKGRNVEGTGLGLAITLSLVRLMGGAINVESEVGVGSVFEVRIPQKVDGDEIVGSELAENLRSFKLKIMESGRRAPIMREPMPYGHVLIVDDVDTNLFVAKGLMRPYELQIDTATSGFEAIDKVKGGNIYDVIFMDHMMPEMDGMEAARHIRDLGYSAPIVALTANAVTGQSEIFLRNGFDSFIAKPIDLRQLNAVLNKLIRDKQPPEIIEKYRKLAQENLNKPADNDASGQAEILGAKIKGLDIAGGIEKFGGDVDGYLRILRSYTVGVRSMEDTLELASSGDISKYTIAVHSIKGMSLDLFADDVGQRAFALETAAKSGDLDYIKENNPVFLEKLRKLVSDLENLLTSDAGKSGKPTRDKPDPEVLSKLVEACRTYHMDGADAAMEELNKYRYSDDDGLVEWLQTQLDVMDFEAIVERLSETTGEDTGEEPQ